MSLTSIYIPMSEKESKLEKLYESNNYPAKTKLYAIQRDAGVGLTQKEVFEWIKHQEVHHADHTRCEEEENL